MCPSQLFFWKGALEPKGTREHTVKMLARHFDYSEAVSHLILCPNQALKCVNLYLIVIL